MVLVTTESGPPPRAGAAAHSSAFFGTLKYEHLYRATIGDGNALAVEVNLFRHTYTTLRPHQALDERTPRAAYLPSNNAISVWPLADPLLDWEVLT